VGLAQFGLHDPIPCSGRFKKARLTETLPVDGPVLPTVQTLEFDEIDLQLPIERLVHVDKVVLKDQKILDRASHFRSHLSQDSLV
jgi:hypothetical protein